MIRRIAILVAAFVCALPATAYASYGNTSAGSPDIPADGGKGQAQDWVSNASSTETLNRLNVYLFSGSGKPDLAIYRASDNARIAECKIATTVSANGWYSCSTSSFTLMSGVSYKRAILSPSSGSLVSFGNHVSGASTLDSWRMKQSQCGSTCNTLPLTWANGASHYTDANQNASMYADSTAPPPPPPPAACADGVDNDNDGLTDYPNDPGCSSSTDNDETDAPPPPPPAACADGQDNDGDGLIDYPNDPGCSSSTDSDETDQVGDPVPGPIAGQGYHEAFSDNFDTLNRAVWDDHIWYDEAPNPAWTNFQTVSNGVLDLKSSRFFSCCTDRPIHGYPMNTVTTQSSGKTFQYGYVECRMKWSAGHGSWPGCWLYSYQHATDSAQCTTQAGEIDVMEGQGSEPTAWYGTVHSNTNGCSPADDQNGNNWQDAGVDLTQGFHTYAVKWTPSTVTWYLDGVQTHSASTYSTDNQPMFLLLQEWTWDGWTFDPDSTTPDNIDNQIDFVRVWQQ